MSRNARDAQMECKVYVGDLPKEAEEKEIERAFTYYGRLKSVWVARNPAGFAFVEFEDPRDAEDAVRGLDGTNVCGSRVRVEHATGKVRPKPWQRRGGGGGGGDSRGGPPPRNARRSSEERCYQCGERGHLSRECPRDRRGGGGGGGGRSSGRRSYSKSRSRSPERKKSYSKSPSRSRSRERTQSFR